MFHCLPNSGSADWNLADVAGAAVKDGGTPKSKSTNPGLIADESPCI